MNSFIQLIQSKYENLSPRQRQLSEFITGNYKEAAFMNSVALAKKLNVSNPTVIRYASALGFTGYPEFQRALQTAVQNELSSIERVALIKLGEGHSVAEEVFETELNNLQSNMQRLDPEIIRLAVRVLAGSDMTLIVGNQVSAMLAEYSTYTLNKIRDDVIKLTDIGLDTSKRMSGKKCSALVFALPRYPTKTLEQMKWLHQKNIPIVVITGEDIFPFQKYAEVVVPVSIKYLSYVDPLASVLCVINTIFLELSNIEKNSINEKLDEFENFASNNNVYYTK